MSLLLDSYRAIGLITSGRMTSVRRLGDAKNFVTCPAGKSFYVYDCDTLRVSLVSRQVPCGEDIICLVAVGSDLTYVAAGRHIYAFRRAECIGEFKREGDLVAHDSKIELLCNFGGGDVLLSLDRSGKLRAWSCHSLTQQDLPECDLGSEFSPKFILHPKTYLNKVLVGGESGLLQLWNFRSGKLVHAFKDFDGKISIECAEQSPAVDVVALGMGDGTILLHNLRFDKTLFKLQHAVRAPVTSLGFFTDARDDAAALLASGTRIGEICVWDLKNKAIIHSVPHAHEEGAILALQFIPGDYALLSCGADNALRSWEMDSATFHLRPLKNREGHSKAATKVRFHPQGSTIATLSSGTDGRALQLLSAGEDRTLRTFHGALDNHAKELSQKCEPNKLRKITSIATSEAREKDWFNVVTTHEGDNNARVWRFEHGTLGQGVLNMRSRGYLKHISNKRKYGGNDADYYSIALTCCISNCGNFAFVGSASGIVSQYNLQSGRFIASFPKQIWEAESDPETAKKQMEKRKRSADPSSVFATTGETRTTADSKARDESERHKGAVTGLSLDGLDEFVFSVGYDSFLRVWDSQTQEQVEKVYLGGSPAIILERTRDGGLFAIALEDLTVVVMDSVSRRIVRKFAQCHQARITDLCFSPNTKWLLTSSMDTCLKIWDLSTSRCVDWLRFPSACTSLSFAPSNEYLATTHVDCNAICLWANKAHFGSSKPDKVAKIPLDVELPCFTRHDEDDETEEDGKKVIVSSVNGETGHGSADSQHLKETKDVRGTIVLSESIGASSRWFTLWHLELIKERNRPIQPAEKPEQVPFFLPSLASDLDAGPAVGKTLGDDEMHVNATAGSRILSSSAQSSHSVFGSMASALSQELEELVVKSRARPGPNKSSLVMKQNKAKSTNGDTDDDDDDEADEQERRRFQAVKRALEFSAFVSKINQLSPSAVDFELRSLSLGPEDEEGGRVLQVYLEWLLIELEARTNFELVQSILGRLLRLYGDSFQEREELKRLLNSVQMEQTAAWKALQSMMQKCLCYVESFSQLNGF